MTAIKKIYDLIYAHDTEFKLLGFPFPLLHYSHKIPTKNSTIINLSYTGQDDTLGVLIRSKPFNDTNKNIELLLMILKVRS